MFLKSFDNFQFLVVMSLLALVQFVKTLRFPLIDYVPRK